MKNNTKFAPADRNSTEEVSLDYEEISQHSCSRYFHYFPLPLLVLNGQRQVVFTNKSFLTMMNLNEIDGLLGKRPGEIMQCTYANEEPGGCGTSGHCKECGALHAVLESINKDTSATYDCQLLQSIDGESHALDLRVHSSPFEFNGTKYYVVTFIDVGDEKNREVMERVFFHDILNSAGSAKSLVDVLRAENETNLKEPLDLLCMALYGLVEEIQTHKELRLAEKGDYPLSLMTLQSLEVVEAIVNEFSANQIAEGKTIEVRTDSENTGVKTDYSLLRRILINMLKNALEATPVGEKVSIGCTINKQHVEFEVKNEQAMEPSVALQVFKRSFSTKGKGRGLGTYSIKILTENYLGGAADFVSTSGEGTTFRVVLPFTHPNT